MGQLLDLVDSLGIAENTLIVFMSDNGGGNGQRHFYHDVRFFNSNGPFRGMKRDLFEGGIRMPLLAQWKGIIDGGKVSAEPVAYYDFMATAGELAENPPQRTDGTSWVPLLTGKSDTLNRDYLYWEFPYMDQPNAKFAICKGAWKGVKEWVGGPPNHLIFLAALLSILSFSCTQSPTDARQSDGNQPNIVFILADDLGWADVGFNGAKYYETPNLDRLATNGITFSNAYANAANCAPTRASILSGQYTPRHGILTVGASNRGDQRAQRLVPVPNQSVLDTSTFSMAEMLKTADYHTAFIGKWHIGDHLESSPLAHGFDYTLAGWDPGETNDLSQQHPELNRQLLSELEAWHNRTNAKIPSQVNPVFDQQHTEASYKHL